MKNRRGIFSASFFYSIEDLVKFKICKTGKSTHLPEIKKIVTLDWERKKFKKVIAVFEI